MVGLNTVGSYRWSVGRFGLIAGLICGLSGGGLLCLPPCHKVQVPCTLMTYGEDNLYGVSVSLYHTSHPPQITRHELINIRKRDETDPPGGAGSIVTRNFPEEQEIQKTKYKNTK